MAALPRNNTARLWVDYVDGTTNPVEHTFQVRYLGTDRAAADAQARVAAWLQGVAAANLWPNWRVIRVRTSLAGEDFSLPQTPIAALTAIVGTNGNAQELRRHAVEWSWVGRAVASKRRVKITLYGIATVESNQFRYTPGGTSPTWVGASIGALNAAGSPVVTIDGMGVIWYSYVNVQYNSYWERRIRVSS